MSSIPVATHVVKKSLLETHTNNCRCSMRMTHTYVSAFGGLGSGRSLRPSFFFSYGTLVVGLPELSRTPVRGFFHWPGEGPL